MCVYISWVCDTSDAAFLFKNKPIIFRKEIGLEKKDKKLENYF